MHRIFPIALSLLMVLFAGTAMADKGGRFEGRLDARGDRIEHRSNHKAVHAVKQVKYKQVHHYRVRGEQINRHFDHKGKRIHSRYGHRDANRRLHRHSVSSVPVVVYPVSNYRHHNNVVSVVIQQPGFTFGWSARR